MKIIKLSTQRKKEIGGLYQICPVFYNNLLKKYSNYSPDTQKNIAIIVKMQHECEEQVRGRFLTLKPFHLSLFVDLKWGSKKTDVAHPENMVG